MKPAMIRPCPGCNRMSRPTHGLLVDYPGTVLRYQGGVCKSCYLRRPKTPADPYTIAGLESFLARRRDRENAMFRRELIATYPHLVREQVTA